MSVTDDTILEQVEFTYDAGGNVIETVTRRRYHNAPASQTGELKNPSETPKARVTYSASYPDALGRTQAAVNYGTNGGSVLSRPSTIPTGSDDVLVTRTAYDAAGNTASTTDASGMVTEFTYDDAGRETSRVMNPVTASSSSSSSSGGCSPSADENVTVETAYNADGNVSSITAKNASTGDQVTQYVYGTTLDDSEIASSLLTRRVLYPDSSGSSDSVTVTYNRQSDRLTLTDQRGTVHTYAYDNLGRTIEDAVTTVGSKVDDTVLRLEWDYEVRGMLEKATSYDAASSGSALNQVQWAYNDFGQLTTSYQEHSGTVNTGTTPKVQYGYASGSANTIRPTSLTYPDSRSLTYSYGTAGGTDDKASRVAGIVESSTTLAGYTYLGLGAVVEVDYTQPDVQYDLIGSTPYAGLDRFNRIIDSRWKGTSSDLDRIEYGYDRVGNRTYREVLTDSTSSYDELYTNDGLYRLADLKRGELNGGHTGMTSTDFEQFWSLDETGNWDTFKQDDNGDGTWDLVQHRTSNKVNEITLLDNTTGSAWGSPAYDAAGNMVRLTNPQATGTGWNELTVDNWNDLTVDDWNDLGVTKEDEIVYDAWNRLISITRADGTQQVNGYDALRRRVTVETWSGGTLDETRHTWFSAGWQALEERVDTSSSAERQNVWGLRYIDDLVLRDRDTTGNGTLDERLYALQDANWNVTSLCSTAGAILERCAYQAYGVPVFLNASYASPQSTSFYAWTTLFAGYHYDADAALYHVRHRTYSPQLGTWLQRDPVGYISGSANLLEMSLAAPQSRVDPSGLLDCDCASKASQLSGSFRGTINSVFNLWLDATYPRQGDALLAPPVPRAELTAEDMERWRLAFWMMGAKDVAPGDSYAKVTPSSRRGVPTTGIENKLHSYTGDSPAIISGGYKIGTSGKGLSRMADCVRIVCNGKAYVIGTDKIGHFLQQGHMLYEIEHNGPNPKFAKAFAQWTEGLPISPAVPGVHDWLKRGRFDFFGFEEDRLLNYGEKWGGHLVPPGIGVAPLAQRSHADVTANLEGANFWDDLSSGAFADAAYFYASGNVGPVRSRRFDICDYLQRGNWVE